MQYLHTTFININLLGPRLIIKLEITTSLSYILCQPDTDFWRYEKCDIILKVMTSWYWFSNKSQTCTDFQIYNNLILIFKIYAKYQLVINFENQYKFDIFFENQYQLVIILKIMSSFSYLQKSVPAWHKYGKLVVISNFMISLGLTYFL